MALKLQQFKEVVYKKPQNILERMALIQDAIAIQEYNEKCYSKYLLKFPER